MKNIIIIGSGLSGISAAYEFKKNNIDVIILDKARNAGGRICSKISSDYCFNHGAQYLTAYSTFFFWYFKSWVFTRKVKKMENSTK